jgi:predicted N-acetyltransferase YhbS
VAHDRRGVGRALVRRVAEWARSAGFETLLLSTFCDVPWNAPYYARLGFEIVPLEAYDEAMLAQRQSDAAAGMRVESRVMMRAPVGKLLGVS